ncbi:7tm 7 domain containing protein [Asbolus verrucosus]|uniref:Gustatory receptor n=1 Tax=Asbolus verrucosus TaxID=1661398 RepID=A0A482VV31_ASBVE|nr:7tm 7 domain containing protein [Asbolus verrucosus]
MQYLHHRFIISSKIFCFNSALSSNRMSKFFLLYNVILVAVYSAILYFRFTDKSPKKLQAVNNVVLILQLISYICTFFCNIISNWLNSKKLYTCLKKLTTIDENLIKFGAYLDHKKINLHFNISFFMAISLFSYVAIADYVFDVVVDKNITLEVWLSVYVPLTVNYFSCYFIVLSLYLLHVRYSLLVKFLKNILQQGIFPGEDLSVVKSFVLMFMKMINVTNSMIPQFSLQICTMFILTFITLTNNLYLLMKDLMFLHAIEIVLIVWAHYQIHLKVNTIFGWAPQLMSINCSLQNHSYELMECYLLIDKNKLDVQVFGMFTVDPSTLLAVTTWIVSYLIIMIQFTPENYKPDSSNWLMRSPTT